MIAFDAQIIHRLRLGAIEKLAAAGLATGCFRNPIMPAITDSEENLDAVAATAKRAGASFMRGGVLFLKPVAQQVFFPFLKRHFPELVERYRSQFRRGACLRGEYAELMKKRVRAIRARYGHSDSPVEYIPEIWEPKAQGERVHSSFTTESRPFLLHRFVV